MQLTFEDNYRRMGVLLGVPLADDPDLALDPTISKRILVEGVSRGVSQKGDFTGKALEDYIHGDVCDYVGARRTVNGTDKAELIAGYARKAEAALIAAGMPLVGVRMPDALGQARAHRHPSPRRRPRTRPAASVAPAPAPAPSPSRNLFQRVADPLRAAYPVKG